MGVNSAQISVSSVTATQLIVQGTGAGQFRNTTGNVSDPFPTTLQNMDAAITIFLGGPGVTTGNGFPLKAGVTIPFSWLNVDATGLFGLAASGTPLLAILAGRQ